LTGGKAVNEEEPYSSNEEQLRYRVVVKFRDDVAQEVGLPYEDGIEQFVQEYGLGPWDEIAEYLSDITLNRLYTLLSPEEIEAFVAEAEANDPTYIRPNFFTYFVIELSPEYGSAAEELAATLRQWESIEIAYVESPVAPPPTSALFLNEPNLASQGYLDAAGINVLPSWNLNLPGADGVGVGFLDVERGWNLNHQDLLDSNGLAKVQAMTAAFQDQREHGTRVLGVVVASANHSQIVGIAPNAAARVLSGYSPQTNQWDLANVLLWALPQLPAGDVCLLEVQLNVNFPHRPVEFEQAIFDVIRTATARGLVVVECAANGALDLDNETDSNGRFILRRGHPDYRDSGAIVVGSATSAAPHTRRPRAVAPNPPCSIPQIEHSNYGSRVDCYAWGECVYTLDTNTAGTNNAIWTSIFSGTSSAGAIIAGVALVAQAIALNSPYGRLTSLQLRALFRNPWLGTPSESPTADRIGPMPNLSKIIERLLFLNR
jgi:hypothetical protein